jgi:hypothetical protein
MATKYLAHGDVRAAVPELAQLALDAAVSPARVLARQAQDQFVELEVG